MRKVEFYYLEVLNETEQLMVFATTFDGKEYGQTLILNTALPAEAQDVKIRKTISLVENISRKKLESEKNE